MSPGVFRVGPEVARLYVEIRGARCAAILVPATSPVLVTMRPYQAAFYGEGVRPLQGTDLHTWGQRTCAVIVWALNRAEGPVKLDLWVPDWENMHHGQVVDRLANAGVTLSADDMAWLESTVTQ